MVWGEVVKAVDDTTKREGRKIWESPRLARLLLILLHPSEQRKRLLSIA